MWWPCSAASRRRLLIELKRALLGDENRRVAEAEFGREFDRLRAAGADDVAGRIRLLIRPRPRIEIAIRVVIAVIGGWAVLRPGLQNNVDRFPMALARRRRVDRIGPVFHAGAERKRDFEPALRHDIEHGVLFREAIWIFQIWRRAPHADFGVLDLRNDRCGNQTRRRHHAVAGVVVLVDDDGVEADLVGEQKFSEIPLIKFVAALGIVIFVREVDPERFVVLVILRQMHVRHKVHKIETDSAAHGDLPLATPKQPSLEYCDSD